MSSAFWRMNAKKGPGSVEVIKLLRNIEFWKRPLKRERQEKESKREQRAEAEARLSALRAKRNVFQYENKWKNFNLKFKWLKFTNFKFWKTLIVEMTKKTNYRLSQSTSSKSMIYRSSKIMTRNVKILLKLMFKREKTGCWIMSARQCLKMVCLGMHREGNFFYILLPY